MTERKEGSVIVALLAISTVIMLTIVGTICMVGGKHYQLHYKQDVRAGVMMENVDETGHEAMTPMFLA